MGVQEGLGVQGSFQKYFAAINMSRVTPDMRAENVRINSCKLPVSVTVRFVSQQEPSDKIRTVFTYLISYLLTYSMQQGPS